MHNPVGLKFRWGFNGSSSGCLSLLSFVTVQMQILLQNILIFKYLRNINEEMIILMVAVSFAKRMFPTPDLQSYIDMILPQIKMYGIINIEIKMVDRQLLVVSGILINNLCQTQQQTCPTQPQHNLNLKVIDPSPKTTHHTKLLFLTKYFITSLA